MLWAWHRWPLPEARHGSPQVVFTKIFPHVLGHLFCICKWQWFLECSPESFPTRKVLDQLWLQKRLILHFIVRLAQVAWPLPEARQGCPSGVHQCLSPPERYLATSASPSDQLWLQKRLIFHFIVAWALWAWHRWPLPEARQGSPSHVHQGLSPRTWPPLHLQVAVVSRMFPRGFPHQKGA